MNNTTLEAFELIGIEKRTSNEPGKGNIDIPALWNQFNQEDVCNQLTGRVDEDVYAVYTDYESDHNGEYTILIGCKVEPGTAVPDGMRKLEVPAENYNKFEARGQMPDIVINQWHAIWGMEMPRKYSVDLEVYRSEKEEMTHAEVDIYIAVDA